MGLIDTILNPALGWLFDLPPWLAILFLSCVLALFGTLIQKWMTDQAKLKRLKEDTKKNQKKYRELVKTDPEKALKIQQQMLPTQMEMMREGLKPLIVTMIPFLVIAIWMGSHFAFEPLLPDQPFTVKATFADGVSGNATLSAGETVLIDEATKPIVDGAAQWMVRAPAGTHTLSLAAANDIVKDNRTVLVTTTREYDTPILLKKGLVTEFSTGNAKLTPLGPVTLFGWKPGWIACYILFSIPISLLLRKALNVV